MSKGKISIANGTLGIVENGSDKDAKHRNEQGLGWIVTGLFVVGDLAGGGIVALPTATAQTSKLYEIGNFEHLAEWRRKVLSVSLMNF